MASFQQQKINKNTAGWRVARTYKEASSDSIRRISCMDAGDLVEKDGTGIGTGTEKDLRPVLGGLLDLSQDVAPEQGCSTTLGIVFSRARPYEVYRTSH